MDEQRKWFHEMESMSPEEAMKNVDNKRLRIYINLADR